MNLSDLEYEAINPDGSNVGAEFTSWIVTQYLDKYWQLEAEALNAGDGKIPFQEQGWLDVTFKSQIVFRGYLDKIDLSANTQRLTYYDIRKSFDDVFTQIIEYPASTSINQMLSSDPPTAGVKPGLLWLLNSGVPLGDFQLYSGEIYMLEGAGTLNDRCGTGRIFQESTELTLGSGPGTLGRGQYYRTTTDLYVRCDDGRDPKYWYMSIENFKDSRIRLGTIEDGSYSFSVPYRIEAKRSFRDVIEPLIMALGNEIYLDHFPKSNGDLGLSYLCSGSEYGKGSAEEPTAFYAESSLAGGAMLVQEATTGGETYNCILGAGPGSGLSQVVAAKADYSRMGHWKEKVYTSSLLGEVLIATITKLWDDQEDGRCWEVEDVLDLTRMPGDWVEITPHKSQPIAKRIMKAVHYSDGKTKLEINARRLEPEDEMRAKSQVVADLTASLNMHITSWSTAFGPQNVDDGEAPDDEWGGAAIFTLSIPPDSIDQEFPVKFYLKFDVVPYEETTESDQVVAHSHGGATGLHNGYGGGETSNETMWGHDIPQHTSIASNNYQSFWVPDFDTGTTQIDVVHSVHVMDGETDEGDYFSYFVIYTYEESPGHDHTIANYDLAVPDVLHVHEVLSLESYDAGNQSHTEDSYAANARSVNSQAQAATEKISFKRKLDTGNSTHLLDVSATVNGIHISGSPFQALYIGDSEEVEIANLILDGENKIVFKVKEHYDPGIPVRAGIRGSIYAKYYLTVGD